MMMMVVGGGGGGGDACWHSVRYHHSCVYKKVLSLHETSDVTHE